MPNDFLDRLKEDPEYFEFWQDFREYCKDISIPDKEKFVHTLPIIYNRIVNDGASYSIYQGLKNFAIKNPIDAADILALIEKDGTKQTLEFSASIINGLSQSKTKYPFEEKILEFINSDDTNRIYSGIDAAYRVVFKNKTLEKKFIKKVHNSLTVVLDNNPTDFLEIITRFYNKHINTIKEAKPIILGLLKLKNLSVQGEVARSLNEEFTFKDDESFFRKCLQFLSFIEPKYKTVYGTIHYRLKDIIVSEPDVIIDFIDRWITNNKSDLRSISVLDRIIEDLYSEHPTKVSALLLEWLNSNSNLNNYAVSFVVSSLSSRVDAIAFPTEALKKLSEQDALLVAFRVVGYILDKKYASEMLYSILAAHYKNERIRNHIASIFANYLIRNYYSVTEILKSKRKGANKTIKSVIDQIIATSENYYTQVSELSSLNEFEPSDKRMKYFLKQQNLQMQKLMDTSEHSENSFLNMFTNVSLRAGKSFFSKYRGEYTQESEMQNIRSSVEVARIQYIDEIGQEKLRLMWQNMRRDELPN